MPSILKVDTIQQANGAAASGLDLGLSFSDQILQVAANTHSAQTTISNPIGTTNYGNTGLNVSITTKGANSSFIIGYRHQVKFSANNNFYGFRAMMRYGLSVYQAYESVADTGNGPYDYGVDTAGYAGWDVKTNFHYYTPTTGIGKDATVTFYTQAQPYSGGELKFNHAASQSNGSSQIIVLEIGA